jgi:hypothetical protein
MIIFMKTPQLHGEGILKGAGFASLLSQRAYNVIGSVKIESVTVVYNTVKSGVKVTKHYSANIFILL